MTRLRKQNGRAAPWKVKYWGLGNEMDGPWQMGHRSAEDYGKFALEGAKLMKWTDPNDQVDRGGVFELPAGVGLDGVEPDGAAVISISTRITYRCTCTWGIAANDFADFMAVLVELGQRIKTAEGIIDASLSGQPRQQKDLHCLG